MTHGMNQDEGMQKYGPGQRSNRTPPDYDDFVIDIEEQPVEEATGAAGAQGSAPAPRSLPDGGTLR